MKLLQIILVISYVIVDATTSCPPEVWGCPRRRKTYSSKKVQQSKVKLRIKRDDVLSRWRRRQEDMLQSSVLCLVDEAECRALRREPWEQERENKQKDGDTKEKKRQVDCPFAVWGCKKRRVVPSRKSANRLFPPGERKWKQASESDSPKKYAVLMENSRNR